MSLLAPFDRPLALPRLGVAGRTRGSTPMVPSLVGEPEPLDPRPGRRRTHSDVARFLTYALLAEARRVREVVPEVEASVDERVRVWSPSLCADSRTSLVSALLESDDAITDVVVSIVGETSTRSVVLVEWHLEGLFNNAGFVNDDLLIEPSGRMVEATGVLVIEFAGGRASQIRCYYDALGFLEQVIGPVDRS
jgi:hypothetical protein